MESLPESAGPTCVNICPCEVPMRFTPGWHSGDAGVCLWAVHGATELRVFTVVACCAAWNGGQHLGTGWCVSVSQPPAEVCLTDLAWDYPGV